ncbi:ABC transporter permease [Flaviaesturariibacter amylovorans]|uniref:ABC transporter permease n=1 Tax=Flaviaesturariibacter amylovorans TaxID=1084520 RepID=A0ABP8GT83_9BACT
MKLAIALKAEMLKTKRTASFYFTLVGAAVIPFTFLLNLIVDGLDDTRKDPLNSIFRVASEMNGLVIFPMFVILVCTLLPQIEYRNNTWKQVLTAPHTKGRVFLAKFLNIHLLLFLFLVADLIFMGVVVVAANFIDPSLHLLQNPFDLGKVLAKWGNMYLAALAIGSFQFWLGLRFRNFIIPIAVGLALWLTGTLMVFEYKSSFATYFPYSFQTFSLLPRTQPLLGQMAWTSLAYALLFLILGFADFRNRRMTA